MNKIVGVTAYQSDDLIGIVMKTVNDGYRVFTAVPTSDLIAQKYIREFEVYILEEQFNAAN